MEAGAVSAVEAAIHFPAEYVSRPTVLRGIQKALEINNSVQVTGPMGMGKTLVLADLARERNFIFVAANRLTNKELASVLTNKIRGLAGSNARQFLNADLAYSDLLEAWHSHESFTLVVDDPNDECFIPDLVKNVGGVTNKKRLVYSERFPSDNFPQARIEIPPLTFANVQELVLKSGINKTGHELQQLYQSSGGNPLYLRYYLGEKPEGYPPTIGSLETNYWNSLDPRSKEIIGYLAIATSVLTLEDLMSLLSEGSVGHVVSAVRHLRLFIREEPAGYSLIHEHFKETVLALLSSQSHKHAYYARKVANLLIERNHYANAYVILDRAGDAYAQKLSEAAEFDAAQQGDIKTLVYIIENSIQKRRHLSVQDLGGQYLALAHARHDQGRKNESVEALTKAILLADESGDQVLIRRAQELAYEAKYYNAHDFAFWIKLSLTIPLGYAIAFCTLQYGRERRLEEEYAFKASISVSLNPYRELVHSILEKDGAVDQAKYADFVIESVKGVFASPTDKVFEGEKKETMPYKALKQVAELTGIAAKAAK